MKDVLVFCSRLGAFLWLFVVQHLALLKIFSNLLDFVETLDGVRIPDWAGIFFDWLYRAFMCTELGFEYKVTSSHTYNRSLTWVNNNRDEGL